MNDLPQSANATHTSPPAPSPATLNTSRSFASSSSSSYDWCSSADAQVGIGLSLLQDLANGMHSSDKDEDEENDIRRRLRYSRWSVGKDEDHAAATSITITSIIRPPMASSPQRPPPFHLHSSVPTDECERRPSLAPSAELTEFWEGASDIYDEYRYSRFPMASKMSMSSQFSVNAVSGVAPTPPVPELRPSTSSSGSRQRVDSTRSRGGNSFWSKTDSARLRRHSPHPLPQVLEGDCMYFYF